jgi:type IV pilus assembly protein PilM
VNFPFFFNGFSKKFLKNDILSIEIGFTNIKVVHSRKTVGDSLKIINFGINATPQGCIKNGIISNFEGIAENLREMIEYNNINEKNVKIVISAGSNIVSKVIYINKHDKGKVEELIREETTRQLPVNIIDQKMFYRVTGESANQYKVLVTVVPNAMIDNYIKLLSLLNFKPLSLEIPFSSVARFFSRGFKILEKSNSGSGRTIYNYGNGTIGVADLGSETTNLSIINNGALEFNRIILSGGRSLDEVIGKKLGVDRKTAEVYKKMHGIVNDRHRGDDIERIVDECIREYVGEILRNIKRSIDFYINRCGGQNLETVFFIGGGSGLKGLRRFAQNILQLPVYTIDMLDFSNIKFEKSLDKEKIRFLVNAVGIALQ